jgi:hypothetical protein
MLKDKRKKVGTKAKKPSNPWHNLKIWLKNRSIWQKILIWVCVLLIVWVGVMYSVAVWYIQSNKDKPLVVGATFTSSYAEYFGLDPKETMYAMINELGIRKFRLVSYWDKIEANQGIYDFSDLDWQFEMAEKYGANVSLAIGLRQPRWPECHMPKWAEVLPMTEWEPKLKDFMKLTMERYKNSPVLDSYQLENEFFLDVFGICPDFSRDRLIREFEFAKNIDSSRPIIISRSNNALGLPVGDPRPDEFAISVYKRVWDKTLTKRYIEYPFPAWFYAMLAGGGKILTGKDMIIHELQTEAWLPEGKGFAMNDINSIPEQNKSLNDVRLVDRIRYGEATGMKEMDLWGVEWWYWRKAKAGDPSLWNVAQSELTRIAEQNEKLKSN